MTATHAMSTTQPADSAARRRPRGRPRLEDVADIENELVEVALAEFLRHGYGGTSMVTIVKAAGVSKTTLYSRFASKEDLFIAMMKKMVQGDLSARIRAVESPSRLLNDMLREFACKSLEIGLDSRHYGVIRLIYGESHRFPELREAGEALAEASRSGIVNVITAYAERQGLTITNPRAPANALALFLRGMHLDIMLSGSRTIDDARRKEIKWFVDLLVGSMDRW
ncbi:MAG: TetR/AcrR family transcriptional regulator [Alphaproteobacteria bacterium]|nr:TetR/AcrR family transcriptional regulator [Alphaproteobacteria bacterium]